MPTVDRFVYDFLHFTYMVILIYKIPIHHEKVILLTYSPFAPIQAKLQELQMAFERLTTQNQKLRQAPYFLGWGELSR